MQGHTCPRVAGPGKGQSPKLSRRAGVPPHPQTPPGAHAKGPGFILPGPWQGCGTPFPSSSAFDAVDLPLLPPHHLVHHAGVALDDLHDLGGHALVGVVGHGGLGQRALGVEGHRRAHGLQQAALGDAGQGEARLVEGLGALGRGADAHRREGAADAREEARLLGQGAGVGHHGEGVHLQAVVVVEAHGLVHAHARVQLEARGLQALARAGVAAVQDRHVVPLGQRVDRREEGAEVRLGVDVLLAVGAEQHVPLGLQAELRQDAGRLYLVEVRAQNLGHGAARHVGALGGAARVPEVAAGVLGVGQVHVGDDVDDAAVGLLGQALVLAAVARLHVEDGHVQALGRYGGEAAVRVAQDEQGIGLGGHHQLVGGRDDVANRLAQVGAHRVQIDVRIVKRQIPEEDSVERVVVVLPGVRQQAVEVPAALLDDLREPDDLGARAHDYQELQSAVALEMNVTVIVAQSHSYIPHFFNFLGRFMRNGRALDTSSIDATVMAGTLIKQTFHPVPLIPMRYTLARVNGCYACRAAPPRCWEAMPMNLILFAAQLLAALLDAAAAAFELVFLLKGSKSPESVENDNGEEE